jgi:hypothetical protein
MTTPTTFFELYASSFEEPAIIERFVSFDDAVQYARLLNPLAIIHPVDTNDSNHNNDSIHLFITEQSIQTSPPPIYYHYSTKFNPLSNLFECSWHSLSERTFLEYGFKNISTLHSSDIYEIASPQASIDARKDFFSNQLTEKFPANIKAFHKTTIGYIPYGDLYNEELFDCDIVYGFFYLDGTSISISNLELPNQKNRIGENIEKGVKSNEMLFWRKGSTKDYIYQYDCVACSIDEKSEPIEELFPVW